MPRESYVPSVVTAVRRSDVFEPHAARDTTLMRMLKMPPYSNRSTTIACRVRRNCSDLFRPTKMLRNRSASIACRPRVWPLAGQLGFAWRYAALSFCAVAMFSIGCGPTEPAAPDVQIDLTLEPSPPVVGDADLSLKLTRPGGAPVEGAEVQVEGNMNHAGMKPSLADLKEVDPGRYTGTLRFTMGGDWFLLITAKTPEGKIVNGKIDVRGVKAQ